MSKYYVQHAITSTQKSLSKIPLSFPTLKEKEDNSCLDFEYYWLVLPALEL